ncbi:hypothetical protein HfxHF1_215 [Halophage HF1]|uniref:Uncharacterized protein n=2 Tax=Haloferacalesvirus TaxID=2843389 RepID=Q8V6S6_9CAUD|nr:hypothetical protein HrrHF2_215 [Halorubrum phage HF2]NP_861616.1 hypothetical protein HfxHF1_215 [Halophage HF1]AAL54950.1 hypothetical protein HrrHF2_215 [Halorubrum phage HF2]AAO61327.1 hypothetical protein HfxHF1_215 [Halophage HF1]QIR31125.1 hypothetical protein HrrHc2_445 [Halorubrum virus Hardycor2]
METLTEKQPPEALTPDTENATYFDPNERNSTPSKFRRLMLYNRGTWHDRREENKRVTHRQDNLAILDSLSGQLELSDFQKKKARRIYDKLDLQNLGKPACLVAFGVCAVVANDDVHDGTRYWPTANDTCDLFTEIADNLGFTQNQQLSIILTIDHRRSE